MLKIDILYQETFYHDANPPSAYPLLILSSYSSTFAEMSLPSTQFNPFGRHERTVASLKNEMNEVLEKLEENNVEWPAVAKQYTNIAEQLIEIVKDIPDYAVFEKREFE